MPRGRPKKVVEEKVIESLVIEPENKKVNPTYTGVNTKIPDISAHQVDVKAVAEGDELAPVEGESQAHRELREIYIRARGSNPIAWEYDRVRLLKILANTK